MKRVCIIGAGASGLSCLSYLLDHSNDFDIDIFEKNNKVGRKILASGNGRCNITNIHVMENHYNDSTKANAIILNNEEYEEYFNSIGLLIGKPDEDGRRYPLSEHSSSVVDVFNKYLNRPNVHLYLNINIDKIERLKDGRYRVNSKLFDYVIVAIGSFADEHDNHISLYGTMQDLGHHFTKMYPSIGPVNIKENLKTIEGLRIDANVKLLTNGMSFVRHGELMFKKDQLSGICVSELSTIMARLQLNNFDVNDSIIQCDLLPQYDEKELITLLKNRQDKFGKNYLLGIFQEKLAQYILNKASSNDPARIAHMIKNLSFQYDPKTKNDLFHVVAGGIVTNEINNNCESTINPNLYIGGEFLNIDGDCGGYNLHFAFSCGIRIAQDIIRKK